MLPPTATPSRWADIVAFTAYWRANCPADGLMPARADLDPVAMKRWLGSLSILDVVDGGRDFVFRLYGSVLAQTVGFDMTGKSATSYPGGRQDVLINSYRAAVDARRPLLSSIIVRFTGRPTAMAWERVVAPLARDGVTVDKLIVLAYRVELESDLDAYRAQAARSEATLLILDNPSVDWM